MWVFVVKRLSVEKSKLSFVEWAVLPIETATVEPCNTVLHVRSLFQHADGIVMMDTRTMSVEGGGRHDSTLFVAHFFQP